MTVFGWVGSDPEFHSGPGSSGDRVTFRLASTPGFFDRSRNGYRELETVWLGVKAWRGLAHNVASSVHKGEPVVVVGRLRAQVYQVDGQERRYQELEATTVGHDLTKGTSMFRRTKAGTDHGSVPAGAEPVHAAQPPTLRPVEPVAARLAADPGAQPEPGSEVRSGEPSEAQPGAA